MAVKICMILLIIIGLLIVPALADYSFQPGIALNSIDSNSSQNNTSAIDNQSVRAEMVNLPLSFIENRGQVSNDVKFMVKTSRETIYFTPSDVIFALSSKNNTSIVRMSFEGANPGQLAGEGLLPGTANFYVGNSSSNWVADVPTYGSVKYEGLYPGVDLVFKGTDGNLKHELMLKPGADPAKIVLAYSGQDNLSIDQNGAILIKTASGVLTDSAPFCYQNFNGNRSIVEGKYRKIDDKTIGFDIKNYNKSMTLVIDPKLRYSTYLGGKEYDFGYGITTDDDGYVYVTGCTDSIDFPIENAFQNENAGLYDVFITKLNPEGNKLVYSTYLGGSGDDVGRGIAVRDSLACVTGFTNSTNFPTKNPVQRDYGGGENDAFVAALYLGGKLKYSTYLGGKGYDEGLGIAVDKRRYAYVTGDTNSTNFPITKNASQGTYQGGVSDAFVTKLSQTGNRAEYSTYLGGSSYDKGEGIAIINRNNKDYAFVTGSTYSDDFPIINAYQGKNAGGSDAFITELGFNGKSLMYSTYLGGKFGDNGHGIALDSRSNIYVIGDTFSSNFPTTEKSYQPNKAGSQDVFVTKLDPTGKSLLYSTYLGGNDQEWGRRAAIDERGNVYVTGETKSTDFPTTKNAYQDKYRGYYDAFMAKLNPAGDDLVYSTYLGGYFSDYGCGLAVDRNDNIYVIGYTYADDFPIRNAYQKEIAGGYDAFIAAFKEAPPNTPSLPSGPVSGSRGLSCNYSTSTTDPDGDQIKYTFNWGDGSESTTDWVNSGTAAVADHQWTKAGIFQVKAMATDSDGETSGYSNGLEVKIFCHYQPSNTDEIQQNLSSGYVPCGTCHST